MKIEKNALEWSVFGVSLLTIAAVAGVLLYAHFTSSQGPPEIRVVLGAPQPSGDGFAVPLDVINDGDATAEEVEVEVTLRAGTTEERSTVALAFVPHGSRRQAWAAFKSDPARGTLDVRVVGYREP